MQSAGIPREYHDICELLFMVDYVWLIDLDKDRAEDGRALRYRYGDTHGYCSMFDIMESPCSCLEMIIALATRQGVIMGNDDAWVWIKPMFDSLGLKPGMDYEDAMSKISRWLNREFHHDGRGGLFTIPDCDRDLRRFPTWTQANWWFAAIDD
jgi:hypothetical protein